MTTLVSLPGDILDRILTSVGDFRTLSASISTCTKLRSVYDAHPNSIRTAVAHNVFGSRRLFFAAVKTLRIERALEDASEGFSEYADSSKARLRSVTDSDLEVISWPDVRALDQCARVCMGIEAFYSQRNKDRLSLGTSRLTPEESEVFRMALLRIWYMVSIMVYSQALRETWASFEVRVSTFYSLFSNQELYELQLVWEWLSYELGGMGEKDTLQLLSVGGLDGFLQRCEAGGDVDPEYDSDWDVEWTVEDDLENIWLERQVDLPLPDEPVSPDGLKPILASISGEHDACSRCKAVLGLDLHNCQNWSVNRWFQCREAIDLWSSLPLGIRANEYEHDMFIRYVRNPVRDFAESVAGATTMAASGADAGSSHPQPADAATPVRPPIDKFDILRGLFDLGAVVTNERLRTHLAQDGWAGITPDDWLCQLCLIDLIKGRLWIWWYAEKASGRVRGCVIRPDCGQGWQCRAQMMQNGIHAQKLNHLTVNTSATGFGDEDLSRISRGSLSSLMLLARGISL